MRQMSQALAATTRDPHGPHHRSNHGNRGAGRYHDALDNLVLGNSVAERFLPSIEGETHVAVSHVLGLCETAGVGIGHGYEFRKRYNFRHDVKPLPHFAVVPAHATMKANSCRSTAKSDCYKIVNEHGYPFVAVPSPATTAGEAPTSLMVSPAPIQARPS